jgi:hypothetical protein
MSDIRMLEARVAAMESRFGTVNLGDWSNDQDVPWWLAQVINPATRELQGMQAAIVGAVQLLAQARLDAKQGEGLMRLTAEIVDDWCGTKVPGRFPPRPHWTAYVQEIGRLADHYAHGSHLREAAFDLGRRVMDRAHDLGKQGK